MSLPFKGVALSLMAGLLLACWLPGWMRDDPDRLALLTQPAAGLAGYLARVPVQPDAQGLPVLMHPDFPLRVIPGCAGADFLGLLAGLLLWVSLRARPATVWLIVPAAWLLTVLANGARLAGLLLVEVLLTHRLPVYLHNAMHAVTGVAVFLPMLVLAYVLWERMVCRERNPACPP